MESMGVTPIVGEVNENVENDIVDVESLGNEFSIEKRDENIAEAIKKLSRKNFGIGFNVKNKLKLSAQVIELIAKKYGLRTDIIMSPSTEADSRETKIRRKRVCDFYEVYDSDIAERALDEYFSTKK